MADMYDITTGAMKIGVAMPVVNDSFRFWSDPGTWGSPEGWTDVTAGGGTLTSARGTISGYIGYDDDFSLGLVGGTVPDDNTNYVKSTAKQFWHANENFPTSMKVYYSICMFNLAGSGGTTPRSVFFIATDETAAMPSPSWNTLYTLSTLGESAFTRRTGTFTGTFAAADIFFRAHIAVRDATSIVTYVDNVGVMFNPFDATAGYYALTNIHPLDGPSFRQHSLTLDDIGRQGGTTRYDPSGGARKLRLPYSIADEPMDVLEQLEAFWSINHGTPGRPGLPLLIEPNLPGFPPTMMCNIVEPASPITRIKTSGQAGGTITFESVYPY